MNVLPTENIKRNLISRTWSLIDWKADTTAEALGTPAVIIRPTSSITCPPVTSLRALLPFQLLDSDSLKPKSYCDKPFCYLNNLIVDSRKYVHKMGRKSYLVIVFEYLLMAATAASHIFMTPVKSFLFNMSIAVSSCTVTTCKTAACYYIMILYNPGLFGGNTCIWWRWTLITKLSERRVN